MIRAYLKAWLADRLTRAAKWLANPKTPRREPIDLIQSREERRSALGSAFVDRTFGSMRDVSGDRQV
jgi:hypothetical protein